MTIDFNKIDETIIPAFKGGEKGTAARMFFDGMNRIMKGRLIPGASIGMHTHDTSSEIIFITKGSGYVIYDGEKIALCEGDVHYCPKELFVNGHRVKYYLDKDFLGTQKVSCHPCGNTASVVISKDDLLKFLSIWGGEVKWIEV